MNYLQSADNFEAYVYKKLDYITAVPLHHIKKRERGYNQAMWIAKGFAKEVGIPMDPNIIKRNTHTRFHKQSLIGKNDFKIWKMLL